MDGGYGLVLMYAGWFVLPDESVSTTFWIVRIGGILVVYAAVKNFALEKYLKASV